GVGKLWDATVGYAAKMEEASVAFETMLGSRDKVTSFLKDLEDFEVRTPFELPQLFDLSRLTLAWGWASDQILPTLQAVGDAAFGLGKGVEGAESIIRALGQMRTTGRVTGEEMMQLTNVGVQAWEILAEKMGTNMERVRKMVERGQLPAEKGIELLIEGMGERFRGMMEKQSRAYLGLMSSIRSQVGRLAGAFGAGILERLEPRLQKIVDWFTENRETVERWVERLKQLGADAAEKILSRFEGEFGRLRRIVEDPKFRELTFWGKVRFAFDRIAQDFDTWWAESGRDRVAGWGRTIGEFLGEGLLMGLVNTIPTVASMAASIFLDSFGAALKSSPLGAAIAGAIGGAAIGSVVPGVGTAAGAGAGAVAGVLTWGASKLLAGPPQSPAERADEVIRESLERAAGITLPPARRSHGVGRTWEAPGGHALGGIFRRPHLAWVAEEGPEALIPLSARMKSRALVLWQHVGTVLGAMPELPGAGVTPAPVVASTSINVTVAGVSVSVAAAELDEDAVALRVGRLILRRVKQALENRV
ncbi:MAG: tape measure protein, partial [Bacillota bacterium]